MKGLLNKLLLLFALFSVLAMSGCMSCIPQYVAPPEAPVSTCNPTGHDPYIPMDHNPSIFNPWDAIASVMSPFLYGPPR
jgi:hypothetical protein